MRVNWRHKLGGLLAAFVLLALAAVHLLGVDADATASLLERERADDKTQSRMRKVEGDATELSQVRPLSGVVVGTVTDETGQELAHAHVCVWPGESETATVEEQAIGICSQSGENGRYRIAGLPDMRFRVSASAPGYASELIPAEGLPLRQIVQGSEIHVDVELTRPGVAIHGRVLDAGGGPVAGAWVRAHAPTRLESLQKFGRPSTPVQITNEDGEFTLWTRPGLHLIAVVAYGYGGAFEAAEAPASDLEIQMSPEAVVEGLVVNAVGEPVPFALVELEPQSGVYDATELLTYSSADGLFRFSRLAGGEYEVSATSEEGSGSLAQSVSVAPGEIYDSVRIELDRGYQVAVELVSEAAEQPCPDGRVRLAGPTIHRSSVDSDGRTVFDGVGPGTYQVVVSCLSAVTPMRPPVVQVIDGPESVHVPVSPGLNVRGRVLDRHGGAVDGAEVSLWSGDGSGPQDASRFVGLSHTDEDGAFSVGGISPGRYLIQASAVGYVRARTVVDVTTEQEEEHLVTMNAGATLSLRVTTAAGDELRGIRLSATQSSEGSVGSCVTDETGECEISGVPTGTYEVSTHSLMRNSDIKPVEVAVTSDDPHLIRVNLTAKPRDRSIEGRVVDPSGAPIVDVRLGALAYDSSVSNDEIERIGEVQARYGALMAITDLEGRFDIEGLSASDHAIIAYKPGWEVGIVYPVRPGRQAVRVQLEREQPAPSP